jgi:hypothetical protein
MNGPFQIATPEELTALRLQLRSNGYHPVPVIGAHVNTTSAGKKPIMEKWQTRCFNADDNAIAGWSYSERNSTNTGLLCGKTVGIDIDVLDQELSDYLVSRCKAHLGQTPLIRIGREPKTLLCYQVASPIKKLQTPDLFFNDDLDGEKAKIEILAEGQQFVASGIHPVTRAPYRWPERSPLDTPAADIPLVTLEALQVFVAEAEQVLRDAGGRTEKEIKSKKAPKAQSGSSAQSGKIRSAFRDSDKPNRETISDALDCIPNDMDYDGWVRIGFALYHGLGDAGRDLWESWSARSSKNNPATTAKKWPSFASGTSITARTIFWEALRNGWRQDRNYTFGSSKEGLERTTAFEPIPLIAELAAPAAFPVEALGPCLGPAAEAIAKKVQTPVALAAQSVLAAAALGAQAHADVMMPFGQTRPLSLLMMTVASSGDRKTSTDTEALWAVRKREDAMLAEYDRELPVWKLAMSAWAAEKKKIESDKKLIYAERRDKLERLGEEPLQPLFPLLTAPDPTIEGLIKAWTNAPASLGLFSAEGGQFVGGHGMSSEHKLKTAAAFSELWDGRGARRLRAGDGLTLLRGRRLTGHIMIQPLAASVFLTDAVLRDQGLLSRCLVAAPTSIAGKRLYRDEPTDMTAIRAFGDKMLRLLERPWPLVEGKRNELEPRILRIGAAAESVWREFYDHVERQSGRAGELGVIADFAGKAAEHAARIAGVITVVQDASAAEIQEAEMANAVTLVDWYIGEELRLAASSMTDPAVIRAKRLLDWIKAQNAGAISLRDICRLAPAELRSKDAAERACKILVDHGWLSEQSQRPRAWAVVSRGGQ